MEENIRQVSSLAFKEGGHILAVALPLAIVVAGLGGASLLRGSRRSAETIVIKSLATPSSNAGSCPTCSLKLKSSASQNVLELTAGQTYALSVNPSGSIAADGTWSADYGSIDASGNYTAPSFQPPFGEAVVTYLPPSGATPVTLNILVAADPAVPDTAYPRYISYAVGATGALNYNANPVASVVGGASASVIQSGNLLDLTAAYPGLPVYEGNPPSGLNAPAPFDCVDPAVAVSSANTTQALHTLAAVTVTTFGDLTDGLLIAVPASLAPGKKPKTCKVGPLFPPPVGLGHPCTDENLYSPAVPTIITKGPSIVPPSQTGSMEFTAGINATLGIQGLASLRAGFNIGVTYPLTRIILAYSQSYRQDVYTCVNGQFKFLKTETCSRSGFGESCTPKWVSVVDQSPVNGAPDPDKWTPWNCN